MIYIHVPFCRSFCIYCDFYSQTCKSTDSLKVQKYTAALLKEISERRSEISAASTPQTLYIGGGTPSVLPLSFFSDVVNALGCDSYTEFTVEVNPDDITQKGASYVKALLSLGVNRISMGVQSLNGNILKWMNRRHDAQSAIKAYSILKEAGVPNVSLDLIFGLSQMSDSVLEQTLDLFIQLRPEHISAYQLSIEEGSALFQMQKRGQYTEASQEQCARQYQIICSKLALAGYNHYEISNWALPGYEAVHNSAYWTRRPYVGLGPSAHSFDGLKRKWNSCSVESWTQESETLTAEQERIESIMLSLRTSEGVDAKLISNKSALQEHLTRGLLIFTSQGKVRIPDDYFFISDSIISSLV